MAVNVDRNQGSSLNTNLDEHFTKMDGSEPDRWKFDKTIYKVDDNGVSNANGHHIIPEKVAQKYYTFFVDVESFGGDGFQLNDANNGVYLPKNSTVQGQMPQSEGPKFAVVHASGHEAYNDYIDEQLGKIRADFVNETKFLDSGAGGDESRRKAAVEAQKRWEALQFQAREMLASDSEGNLKLFLYRGDSILNRHLVAEGKSRIDGPLSGGEDDVNRKAKDLMNEAVFDERRKEVGFSDRLTSADRLFASKYVLGDDGKIRRQNSSVSQSFGKNMRGFSTLEMNATVFGLMTVGLVGAVFVSRVRRYFDNNDLPIEEIVAFLQDLDVDLDLAALTDSLGEAVAETALLTLAKALGGPVALAVAAYEIYESYEGLRYALKMAGEEFHDNQLIAVINENLDKAEEYIEAFVLAIDSNNDEEYLESQRVDLVARLNQLYFSGTTSVEEGVGEGEFDFKGVRQIRESKEQIVNLANQKIAWRYALRELNPFVVSDANYDQHNTDGTLDKYDSVLGTGYMTKEWIEARAAFLFYNNEYRRKGTEDGTVRGFLGLNYGIIGNVHFSDKLNSDEYELTVDGWDGWIAATQKVHFGGDEDESFLGSSSDDRFFGAGGSDGLIGGEGNDHLEGGEGDDRYLFDYGDGRDTIYDIHGENDIYITFENEIEATNLDSFEFVKGNSASNILLALNQDGTINKNLFLMEKDLGSIKNLDVVIDGGMGGVITIKNFKDENFTFDLTTTSTVFKINHDRTGDVAAPINVDVGTGLSASGFVEHDRMTYRGSSTNVYYDAEIYEPNNPSSDFYPETNGDFEWFNFFTGSGADTLHGGDYSLIVYSGTWEDFLLAGAGDDIVWGEEADVSDIPGIKGDIIVGGTGSDSLYGMSGADVIIGGGGTAWHDLGTVTPGTAFWQDWMNHINSSTTEENNFWNGGKISNVGDSDYIDGGSGSDYLVGGGFDDVILGQTGWDVLLGFGGGDTLIGGSGNDDIYGDRYYIGIEPDADPDPTVLAFPTTIEYDLTQFENYDDFIDAGSEDDYVLGEAGSDTIFGGSGVDIIFGDNINKTYAHAIAQNGTAVQPAETWEINLPVDYHGNDFIDGGDDDDYIFGNSGNDHLVGGDGADELHGDDHELLESQTGNDVIDGGAGNDVLIGGGGNDVIHGGDGSDTIYGDNAHQGNNYHGLNFGLPNLFYYREDDLGGDDIIYGGIGNDTIYSGGGFDTVYGGDGSDTIYIESGEVDGGAGLDTIYTSGGAGVVINGGAGNDTIHSASVNDRIMFNGFDGNDTIAQGSVGTVELIGLQRDDVRFTFHNDDVGLRLNGSSSGLLLEGFLNADEESFVDFKFLDTGETLTQEEIETSWSTGTDFVDHLYGVSDSIRGGGGDDFIHLLEKQTSIYFNEGDGLDTIQGEFIEGIGHRLVFEGITSDRLSSVGVRVDTGGFEPPSKGRGVTSLELLLDDGSSGFIVEDYLNFVRNGVFSEVVFDDVTLDFEELIAPVFVGSDSDNVLYFDPSHPIISGGAGDDSIFLTDSNGEIIKNGELNGAHFVVDMGPGTDMLHGPGYLKENARLDFVFREGSGVDWVAGRGFDLRGLGKENTLIIEGESEFSFVVDPEEYGLSGWGSNISHAGAELTNLYVNAPLSVVLDNSGDEFVFSAHYYDRSIYEAEEPTFGIAYAFRQIDSQVFQGTLHKALTERGVTVHGISQGMMHETLLKSIETTASTGYDPEHVLWKLPVFELDGEIEHIIPLSIPLTVYGRSASEEIVGTVVKDTLYGGEGHDQIHGLGAYSGSEDLIYGEAGDDQLWAGRGVTQLSGGQGNDIYHISLLPQELDENVYPHPITSSYVINEFDEYDVIDEFHFDTLAIGLDDENSELTWNRNGDDLLIGVTTTDDTITVLDWFLSDDYQLEKITVDGDDINLVAITASLIGYNPTISGDAEANNLGGTEGDDIIEGLGGDDIIESGAGNDTFLWNAGDGNDTIIITGNAEDQNKLVFGEDVADGDLNFTRIGQDLIITNVTTAEEITISGWFNASENQLDSIELDDGTALDLEALLAPLDDQNKDGTGEADTLEGDSYNDILNGLGGNDLLSGFEGDDILNGGTGQDTLIGGTGNDTYVVDNANDSIVELITEGNDTVLSSVDFTLVENVENLVLLEGAVHGIGNALDNQIEGNSLDNVLDGQAGNDVLIGGEGADQMIGGEGNDTFVVENAGDSVIEASGESSGNDTVQASIDYVLGENVENLILTGEAVRAEGNELGNRLIGNDQANDVIGGFGDDYLDGGAGADVLMGGLGDDTYVIDDVNDVIIEQDVAEVDDTQNSEPQSAVIRIEAEDYDAYWDSTTGNEGGEYRNDDVDIAWAGDTDGAYAIGWTEAGEWTEYNIVLEHAGNYSADVRVASDVDGGVLQLQMDGSPISADLSVGITGGWSSWETRNLDLGYLSAGQHTFRAHTVSAPFNLNWIELKSDELVVTEPDTSEPIVSVGNDTVISAVNYTLGDKLENLVLQDTAWRGVGNDLDNKLYGNQFGNELVGGAGDDLIDGGDGWDLMYGGDGSDTFIVDSIGDIIVEQADDTDESNIEPDPVVIRIEAESYDRYWDSTPGNDGGDYSEDDVDIGWAGDVDGGQYTLGWVDAGEWLEYDIVVPETGNYRADFRLATEQQGGAFKLQLNGNDLTPSIGVNTTGGWSNWDTQNVNLGSLSAGKHTLRMYVENGPFNLNWIELQKDQREIVAGSIFIEAEDYVNYWDSTTGNQGDSNYRGDDVDMDHSIDSGGGHVIGWITAGEWLEYTINVEHAGQYNADARVASLNSGGSFHIEIDGNVVSNNESIGATGGWNHWETRTLNIGYLSEGEHTLRVRANGEPFNFNWLDLKPVVAVEEEVEAPDVDTVYASLSYALNSNIENLVLTDDAVEGEGNALDNFIMGNAADNVLKGAGGNDILEGGIGNDTLDGGRGIDVLKFARGDGQDIVRTATGFYVLALDGIQSSELSLSLTADTLVLDLGSGDSLTLKGFDANRSGATQSIAEIRFNNNGVEEVWDWQTLSDKVEVMLATTLGTDAAETIQSDGSAQQIAALGGDDEVSTKEGDDRVSGGAGNDYLEAGSGNDVILGGTGTDIIYGQGGDDQISGGRGYDLLKGGSGNDSYFFSLGDAKDVIEDTSGIDSIGFGEGITYESLKTEKRAQHLVIQYGDQGDEVMLNWHFKNDARRVESINFSNGDSVSIDQLLVDKPIYLMGTAFVDQIHGDNDDNYISAGGDDDTLMGKGGNDKLWGGDGNDELKGGSGDDELTGGEGNDTLIGGEGNNTYFFDAGDGNDLVRNSAGDNRMVFGDGLTTSNLWFEQEGNDLIVTVRGSEDSVTVENWFGADTEAKMDEFEVNGKVLTELATEQLVQSMASFGSVGSGEASLTPEQENQVAALIAENWS